MNFEKIFMTNAHAQTTSTTTTSSLPDGQAAKAGGAFQMFLPMILVFVIFYFLMIRPQSKQRKQHQQLLQNLKKGDDVVTSAGIHGKIYGVADNVVTVEIADNIRIKMDKQQVATVKVSTVS